jgi:hypothetical protein
MAESRKKPPRKVIQIATTHTGGMTALLDDGSIWIRRDTNWQKHGNMNVAPNYVWYRQPGPPGTE